MFLEGLNEALSLGNLKEEPRMQGKEPRTNSAMFLATQQSRPLESLHLHNGGPTTYDAENFRF